MWARCPDHPLASTSFAFLGASLTSVVAAGILKRLVLVDAVEALAAAVEVGRARAPGGPAACSRYSGRAWQPGNNDRHTVSITGDSCSLQSTKFEWGPQWDTSGFTEMSPNSICISWHGKKKQRFTHTHLSEKFYFQSVSQLSLLAFT